MADVVRSYEIRISAVLDRSTAAAAGDFVQQFERAHRTTGRSQVTEAQRAQRYVQGIRDRYFADEQRREEAAQKASARTQEAGQKYVARIRDRYFMDQQRSEDRKEREALRGIERKEREAIRSAERVAKKEEQISKQALETRRAQVRQIASDTMSNLAGVTSRAVGIYGGIARGAGATFDLGSLVGRAVSNESLATRISGYGYVEGEKGAAGTRQDPRKILEDAKRAANASAIEGGTGSALEGLSEFTKHSSDLETGRAILEDMAKYAKATGSNFNDVARAAGDVAKKLGDVPDKAAKIKAMMNVFGRQGKLGAIDMSDLAPQISSMIGPANKFASGSMAAMTQLGVAMQITKSFGGVKGPAQAATGVANFVNYLTSAAGQKNLLKGGLKEEDIFADKNHKTLKDIEPIILAALKASGGDLTKMSKMFRNTRANSVLQGFAQVYGNAENAEKGSGAGAVKDIFRSYGSALTQKDLGEQLGAEMRTSASQVQLFNNKMEEVGEQLASKLLPQMNRLAPTVLKLADAMSQMLVFAAENPGRAITLAIVGSIGKATLGPMIAKALTESIVGRMGGAPGTPGFQGLDATRKGAFGMQAGTTGSLLGSGLAIGTVAVTTFTVGSMIVDKMVEASAAADTGHMSDELRIDETKTILKGMAKTGQISEADQAKVRENIASLEERINIAKDRAAPFATNTYAQATANYIKGTGPSLEKLERGDKDKNDLSGLQAELAAQKAELAKMANGITNGVIKVTGKVEISNMPAAPGAGRDGTPDH